MLESRLVSALTAPHGVDRYLGLVNPLWSVREIRAEVVKVVHHTADTVTLTLRPNGNWAGARAGQYVRCTVLVNGVQRTRCFSLANSARRTDGLIELTPKVNPAGTVSRYLKEHAAPGLLVGLSPAAGEFVLPDEVPEHILLMSGGSGITPVMSLLRTLIDDRYAGRITFLHYARTPPDVVYRDELAALAAREPGLRLVHAYTRQPGAGTLDGRFGREHLLAVAPGYRDALTYVCGPAPLQDAVSKLWDSDGIGDRLRTERFTLAVTRHPGDATGEVRFARSGVAVPNSGRTLLEQAEAAGLRPEYGCRMGVCHSCSNVKADGAVRDVRSGAISSEPGERIQLCVTVPCGDVEVEL